MDEEAIFQYCVSVVLKHEGGLSNDPHDPGGLTNYGISMRFALEHGLVPKKPDEFIRNMTPEGAANIYRHYWWNPYHYSLFTQRDVVAKVFDLAVNVGQVGATKILQEALNHIGETVDIDGILGAHTISAANSANSDNLRDALRLYAKNWYENLIVKNPNLESFRNGWLKRAAW